MVLSWYDWVGTVGVVAILVVYFLLQIERIDVQGLWYSAVNFVGSALIGISLLYEFNFSAVLIEVCWMVISLIGIVRVARLRQRDVTQ